MKYPKKQFEKLIEYLKELSKYIDIYSINTSLLHFIVYTQGNEGNKHNHLYFFDGSIKKKCQLSDIEMIKAHKILEVDNTFELYPDGCNDTHIETAMKKALKQLSL